MNSGNIYDFMLILKMALHVEETLKKPPSRKNLTKSRKFPRKISVVKPYFPAPRILFHSNLDEKVTSNEQKVTTIEQKITSNELKISSNTSKK